MIRHSRSVSRLALVVLAGLVAVLSGCSSGVKNKVELAKIEKTFDMTLQSYKGGQFLLDGAVLSQADLGSHFRYLNEQGELPKRVLLAPGEKKGIQASQVKTMAYLELKYGVQTYYYTDGVLRKIAAVKGKGVKFLRDNQYKGPPLPDHSQDGSAKGTSEFPTGN
ncbi:hypothetical protein [Oleiagrimonas sp.]|jgi:hypothetical protein|uniref:hypothetical protein n=1 Tax=Oleiagrimonas sp. TaxID=2010330 RepID=UPI00262029E2|nr:hypothetical protein [Oleiagrimonas sp.]MDA3913683.1 hypothetical protein [Oleiagrimonas sp.]